MRCLNGSDAQSTGAARHPGLRVARDAPRGRQAMAPSVVAVCFFDARVSRFHAFDRRDPRGFSVTFAAV